MLTTFAVETVIPMSIVKPLVMMAVLAAWGRWASKLDKDAAYFMLRRQSLNGMTVAAAALGFLLWFIIPIYIIGMLLCLMLMIGAGVAYTKTRNLSVPTSEQWHLSMAFFRNFLLAGRARAASRQTLLRFVAMGSKTSSDFKPVPLEDTPQHAAHLKLETLLESALSRHAQKLELAVGGEGAVCQLSVDGVNMRLDSPTQTEALAVLDYLKGECAMDVADRRKKQVGKCKIDLGEYALHDLRVNTAGSTRGVTASIEFDPHQQLLIGFDHLGLLEGQIEQLKPVLRDSEGLVLVTAPSDEGRTVTLYALLTQHDPYLMDIHSLEEPIELDLEGVTQHEPKEEGWAKSLSSLLLRDPAVMMLSQVPDQETAQIAAKAALDHKRLYVGIKAEDTFAALKMWAKAIGDLNLAADSLRAVTCQRLVRRLCPTCRVAYQPDAGMLRKLNLPADRIGQFYKSSGKVTTNNQEQPCPNCKGLGYRGRTAAFEVMVFDDEARNLLRKGDTGALRAHLRKNRMLWLQEAALAKVVNGETSISEVMRALGTGESPAKPTNA
ncbi:MAG: ATPase, T2SS/T4P/T4SS family [Phycisphaeraceae bacterium]